MTAFWKNVSSVFTGAVIAQLIPVFGSLFITRIFTPAAFGEYSVWLAAVTFVAVIVTLRFETALAIVEDGAKRKQAVFFSILISLCVALGLLSVFLFIGAFRLLPESFFFSQFNFLVLVVPAALVLACNQVFQSWAAAEGLYTKLTLMRLTQAGVLTVLQVVIGIYAPSALSLAVSFVIAGVISLIISKILMPKFIQKNFMNKTSFLQFLTRYKNFPIYSLPADSINTAAAQLPVIIIAYRFGADIAGFLALTMRVLGAPIGLVGKAVLDVFKRYAAQSFLKTGNCKQLYINTLLGLSLASVVLIIGTVFFGETIFKVAFGEDWVLSGVMAIWLLPMFAMRFIASPLSYMVYIVEKQYIDLLWQIALAIVVVLSLFSLNTYKHTLVFYSLSYALMYCFYVYMSYSFSKGLN